MLSRDGGYQRLCCPSRKTSRKIKALSLGVAVGIGVLLAGEILEVGVVAGLLGGDAAGGVVDE